MIKTFIEKPVLTAILSIFIILFGILALITMPLTQYPDIAPPTIQVTANYPGANAETLLSSVIIPLEEQINGVEGMTYISSTASNNGTANISVFFHQSTDADIAAINVQNRVARAAPLLPSEVNRIGIVTQKRQNTALMFLTFYTTSTTYDVVYLQNYLNIHVVPELKRIYGVGDVVISGAKDYAMRIWLDPARLASYHLVPADVTRALQNQSLEASAGQLGENAGQALQYVIKYSGKYNQEKQYEDIVIKSLANGKILRLKDIAKIEMNALSYSTITENNGEPGITIGIFQTPGSNAQKVINEAKDQLAGNEYPEGIDYVINYDTNRFLDASISKVIWTLLEATVLVLLVVFIFLQDIRSTLIPAITIPISIIGTFFFLDLFGFSINLLTLFALILAIGIVVDDAIVVVEAVHSKLNQTDLSPKKATLEAMREITRAIISISFVMAAVFIPVTFIRGPVGIFYQQFGTTLMIAIGISALSALSLSPMLCALFLKKQSNKVSTNKHMIHFFYQQFNQAFKSITSYYTSSFSFFFRHQWITLILIISSLLTIGYLNQIIPKGFIPNEDRGVIFSNIELPPGASIDRTYKSTEAFREKIKNIAGVDNIAVLNGNGIISGAGSNYATAYVRLEAWKQRSKNNNQSMSEIITQLFQHAADISDSKMIFFGAPSIPGFGSSAGFDLVVLDKTGGEIHQLDRITKDYIAQLEKQPEIHYAQSPFNTNYSQYEILIDVSRAEESGISVSDIFSALQGYIGGLYASDFTRFGKQFRVMLQALPEERINEQSLNNIYVRNSSNQMAAITQFIRLEKVYGPQAITRFNLFNSAAVSGAPSPGYSSGDAIRIAQQVAEDHLPSGYGIDYSGITREERQASSQTLIIFLLCLLFIYLILCAQYESFLLPFAVLLSLPFGIMGAYIAQRIAGLDNTIYFQIALIMLIGLLAKNAILIIEFARQRRADGVSISKAAITAAAARLRPILMTSLAFIIGLVPLILASGAGAVGSRSIGTGAAFGLLIGTCFGVFVVPVLFIIFQSLHEKISTRKI